MRLAGVCLSVVCACAPRWTQPEFREEASARAIATAVRDYACPREQVSVRCDASSSTKILHGRTVVYDEDGVVGTYVTETPTWEVELAVCGHLRRYRYSPPTNAAYEANVWGAPEHGMVEEQRGCGGAYCVGAEPACTNCGRQHWWPVDTTLASTLCRRTIEDDSVAIQLDDNSIEIVVDTDGRRDVTRRCGESPLFVAIDGAWFSLCGDGRETWVGEHRIPTGITLGTGRLSGRAHTIEAIDVRDGTCHRAKTAHVTRPRNETAWTGPLAPRVVRKRTSWHDL